MQANDPGRRLLVDSSGLLSREGGCPANLPENFQEAGTHRTGALFALVDLALPFLADLDLRDRTKTHGVETR